MRTSRKVCVSILLVAVLVVVEPWTSVAGKSAGHCFHMGLERWTGLHCQDCREAASSADSQMREGRGYMKEIHCK